MKVRLFVILLFSLAALSFSTRKGPRLSYVPRNIIVLDTVEWRPGLSLEGTFSFQNTGDSTLLMTLVTTTCYCFEVDSITPRVEPGEYGIVHAVYHPKGRGKFNQAVVFATNALPEPRRFYLRGYVK